MQAAKLTRPTNYKPPEIKPKNHKIPCITTKVQTSDKRTKRKQTVENSTQQTTTPNTSNHNKNKRTALTKTNEKTEKSLQHRTCDTSNPIRKMTLGQK